MFWFEPKENKSVSQDTLPATDNKKETVGGVHVLDHTEKILGTLKYVFVHCTGDMYKYRSG